MSPIVPGASRRGHDPSQRPQRSPAGLPDARRQRRFSDVDDGPWYRLAVEFEPRVGPAWSFRPRTIPPSGPAHDAAHARQLGGRLQPVRCGGGAPVTWQELIGSISASTDAPHRRPRGICKLIRVWIDKGMMLAQDNPADARAAGPRQRVHRHGLGGRELPTMRSSRPVAFAFAWGERSRRLGPECRSARETEQYLVAQLGSHRPRYCGRVDPRVPDAHCVPIRRLLKNARRMRSDGPDAGCLSGFATERDSLHYSTVSVPSMPDSRCPATEQKNT